MNPNTRKSVIKKAISQTVETWFDTTIAAAAARLEEGMTAGGDPNNGEDRTFLMFPFILGGY
jgi:hypothetical protein